ncbi:MAG: hypothetical protein M3137_04170 [Actinomycetota bacterium]|nr:hypothetical protein [Actinomycetota bacterium]
MTDDGEPVASMHLSLARFSGSVTLDGQSYRCKRLGPSGTVMVSEDAGGGTEVGRAAQVDRTPATRTWTVATEGRTLQMKSEWVMGGFDVSEGGSMVGQIAPSGMAKRTIIAEVPDTVPLRVRLLMVFTVCCVERQRRRGPAPSPG